MQLHPSEAGRLADKILENIRRLTDEVARIDPDLKLLHKNWEGHRKVVFVYEAENR